MQIEISAAEVELLRKWVVEPLFIPMLIWGYTTLKKKINFFITENVNRVRDELKIHVDEKIKEHELVEMKFFNQMKQDFDEKHRENKQTLSRLEVQK